MTPEQFLKALRRGPGKDGGFRCLEMFAIEDGFVDRLRSDVRSLRAQRPASRPADRSHVTHWTAPQGEVLQYSLLNRTGRTDDFLSDHDFSCQGKWFFDDAIAPALGELISAFPHLVNFRMNVLGPGAELPAHEEQVVFRARNGRPAARLRFHLPVETNEDAALVLDGAVFSLPPGRVYLVNQCCVHAARNRGSRDRTHIVWDALLTARLIEFLFCSRRVPEFLKAAAAGEVPPSFFEPVGPYRRMASNVSKDEAARLGLCEPQ